jgi:hypothetical protein
MDKEPPGKPFTSSSTPVLSPFPARAAETLFLRTSLENCPFCGANFHVGYNSGLRLVIHLTGEVKMRQAVLKCSNSTCPGNEGGKTRYYQAEEYLMAALPKCTFGLDVTLYTGYLMDIQRGSLGEAHAKLQKLGMVIDQSTVYRQFQKYRALLAGISIKEQEELGQVFKEAGGYVLSLDATVVDNSPPLLTCLELTTGRILHAGVLSSENNEEISGILKILRERFGQPVAVVSDMKHGILLAVKEVFPGVKHQYCHYHFLRNVGKGLMGADNDKLNQLKQNTKKN